LTTDETKEILQLADELSTWIDEKDTAPALVLIALGLVQAAVIVTTSRTCEEAAGVAQTFSAKLYESVLQEALQKAGLDEPRTRPN
jgi:uncharacterized protein YejL (UPF0352 family)